MRCHPNARLRIALLTYRGKPTCGGQGVYARQLSRALVDLGHHVEVFSGPPYPDIDAPTPVHELPSFDFYDETGPMQWPPLGAIRTFADWVEVGQFATGVFPDPLAFSLRAWRALRSRVNDFDIVLDNQSLGYGLLAIEQMGLPVIATIHHPVTIDRRLEIEAADKWVDKYFRHRWYSFTTMQGRVARRLRRVITDSDSSQADIHRDYGVPLDRLNVVPVGVDQDTFRPLPHVQRRPGRLVSMASADAPMKGLRYLLEALAQLRRDGRDTTLLVIGKLKPDSPSARTIRELGLGGAVEFVNGVSDERLAELLNEAEVGVVPSLYEGFSLPAIEIMCSGVPLVATTGGALPEVVGADGDTALLAEPGDAGSLATAIGRALDDGELRTRIAANGRRRAVERWTWRHTALATVEHQRALLEDSERVESRRPGGREAAPRFAADPAPELSAEPLPAAARI